MGFEAYDLMIVQWCFWRWTSTHS